MAKNPPPIDYGSAAPAALDGAALQELQTLCVKAQEGAQAVAQCEAALAAAQRDYSSLVNATIPEFMLSRGVRRITLLDGTEIRVEDDIRANISTGARGTEDNRPAAFAWLRENGFGSLIKTEVAVAFGMGEEHQASELYQSLIGKFEAVSLDASVHSSTLRSFVVEQLQKGANLPPSINIVSLPVAKIKEPKK